MSTTLDNSEKDLLLPKHHVENYQAHSVNNSLEKNTSNKNTNGRKRKYRCDNFLPCDPRRWMHRYLMLAFMCFLSFGSYYCFDNPAALTRTIINVMKVDTTRYTLLYSLYSWPNVILSLIGGVLVDRVLGVRIGTVVFSLLITVGQVIFALGGIVDNFNLMLVGRFVFG
jgi:nitrate/nitrite transporter NarK